MRKALFILTLLMGFNGIAQEEIPEREMENNELKLNALYLILGFPEITYERILNEESAIGVSVAFSIDSELSQDFLMVPYYRFYFGNKRAAGFFMEGNAGIFNEETDYYYSDGISGVERNTESSLGLGLGIAVGGKFMTNSGWVAEIVGGLGRNLINTDKISEVYPRFGITVGKRF